MVYIRKLFNLLIGGTVILAIGGTVLEAIVWLYDHQVHVLLVLIILLSIGLIPLFQKVKTSQSFLKCRKQFGWYLVIEDNYPLVTLSLPEFPYIVLLVMWNCLTIYSFTRFLETVPSAVIAGGICLLLSLYFTYLFSHQIILDHSSSRLIVKNLLKHKEFVFAEIRSINLATSRYDFPDKRNLMGNGPSMQLCSLILPGGKTVSLNLWKFVHNQAILAQILRKKLGKSLLYLSLETLWRLETNYGENLDHF